MTPIRLSAQSTCQHVKRPIFRFDTGPHRRSASSRSKFAMDRSRRKCPQRFAKRWSCAAADLYLVQRCHWPTIQAVGPRWPGTQSGSSEWPASPSSRSAEAVLIAAIPSRSKPAARHLAYRLKTDGGWIFVSAGPMDTGDSELLVSLADGKAGWNACSRPHSGPGAQCSRTLQPRPLELGQPGSPDCFVIG